MLQHHYLYSAPNNLACLTGVMEFLRQFGKQESKLFREFTKQVKKDNELSQNRGDPLPSHSSSSILMRTEVIFLPCAIIGKSHQGEVIRKQAT